MGRGAHVLREIGVGTEAYRRCSLEPAALEAARARLERAGGQLRALRPSIGGDAVVRAAMRAASATLRRAAGDRDRDRDRDSSLSGMGGGQGSERVTGSAILHAYRREYLALEVHKDKYLALEVHKDKGGGSGDPHLASNSHDGERSQYGSINSRNGQAIQSGHGRGHGLRMVQSFHAGWGGGGGAVRGASAGALSGTAGHARGVSVPEKPSARGLRGMQAEWASETLHSLDEAVDTQPLLRAGSAPDVRFRTTTATGTSMTLQSAKVAPRSVIEREGTNGVDRRPRDEERKAATTANHSTEIRPGDTRARATATSAG